TRGPSAEGLDEFLGLPTREPFEPAGEDEGLPGERVALRSGREDLEPVPEKRVDPPPYVGRLEERGGPVRECGPDPADSPEFVRTRRPDPVQRSEVPGQRPGGGLSDARDPERVEEPAQFDPFRVLDRADQLACSVVAEVR